MYRNTKIGYNAGLVHDLVEARYKHLMHNLKQPQDLIFEQVKNWFDGESALRTVSSGSFDFNVEQLEHTPEGWKFKLKPKEQMCSRSAEFKAGGNYLYVGSAAMSDWLYRSEQIGGVVIHTVIEVHPIFEAGGKGKIARCELSVYNYDDEKLKKLPIGDTVQQVVEIANYLNNQ